MDSLYHETNKLIEETYHFFVKFDTCLDHEAESLEREIQNRIDYISKNCERLDLMAHKESLGRMQTTKSRIAQLKLDNKHLEGAFRVLCNKRKRLELEKRETEELLQRKFTPLREDSTIIIDHSIQHQNSLQRANRNLDDLISAGTSVLENLREQKITLKGAHKKMMDVANTLGLSNTTMRLIENRIKEDKYILLGGMFITMLVIVICIFYIKK